MTEISQFRKTKIKENTIFSAIYDQDNDKNKIRKLVSVLRGWEK